MSILRPTAAFHSSSISSGKIFSVVANANYYSNVNAANIAWKYLSRADVKSASMEQLRSYHFRTDYIQNCQNPSHGGPPAPFLLFLSSKRCAATSLKSLSQRAHGNIFPRGMSSNTSKSTVNYPTIGVSSHAAGNTENEEAKQTSDEHMEIEKLPASQRARLLFKKYGMVFVGTYIAVYWTVLLTFYVGLDSGLLDPDFLSQVFRVSKDMAIETADIIGPTGSGASMEEAATAYAEEVATDITKDKRTLVDVVSGYLNSWEWSKKYAHRVAENPHLANLAVAWFMVKFTEPVRLAAAVMLTPKVAKALGRDGKTAATREENSA
ncbi:hypothetical protein ACHAXA_007487 [Cyclostephanos tholiformis]|uniref:DUF1279 domain-containing protein n=1 Tax=Cyclostephanos tholiformis TaxID=382380 RepID=A0ABD3REQ3_9STRA